MIARKLPGACRLLAAGLAAGLGACALPPRPPANITAPAPLAWNTPLPHGGDPRQLAAWWQQLGDPVLAEVIRAAQEASPTVAQAVSRIAQAEAARVAAGAALLPAVRGEASVSRGNAQPPLPLSSSARLGANASWELDLFGGRAAALEAADWRLRGAQAGWHDARVSVAAEAAGSYLGLRNCERLLEVARGDAASRAETARLVQLSAEAGFTAPADAALARASSAEASARTTQQRAACEGERKALVALTGIDEGVLRTKIAAQPAPALPEALFAVDALPARLLVQRPDLLQAELAVAAASADIGAAEADRYPRITLGGSVTAGVVRLNGDTSVARLWSLGPLAVSMPLFDAGRTAAQVDAARARYAEAVALYRAQARQAVAEVERALVALDSTRGRYADLRTAAEGYEKAFEATEARYRNGLASLVELEDARRRLLAARTALAALEREQQSAWISLYRAAGGGWTGDKAVGLGDAGLRTRTDS